MSNKLLNELIGEEIQHQIVIKVKREKGNKTGNKTRFCKGLILSWKMKAADGQEYVLCGHSMCDNKDRFNHEIAYKLAIARAIKRFSSDTYEIPQSIKPEFKKMLDRMKVYYKNSKFPNWLDKVNM